MLGDQATAETGLNKLKEAFARFAQNQQIWPLVYESKYLTRWPKHVVPEKKSD